MDPTLAKPELCYVYRVQENHKPAKHFKTVHGISELRTLRATSRATRVWKVIEVKSPDDLHPINGAQAMVLKDVWVYESGKTEREIQDGIFAKLQGLAKQVRHSDDALDDLLKTDDEARVDLLETLKNETWARYFLTIHTECTGARSKRVPVDAVRARGVFSTAAQPQTRPSIPSNRSIDPDIVPPKPRPRLDAREFEQKKRYCVVFEEVCTALHKLGNFHDVCSAMLDCLKGRYFSSAPCATLKYAQAISFSSLLAMYTGTSVAETSSFYEMKMVLVVVY
jgi:hypothetical protein